MKNFIKNQIPESQSFFLSEILEKPVFSADNKKAGKLKGLAVDMSTTFPKVAGLAIDIPFKKRFLFLPIKEIKILSKKGIKTHKNHQSLIYEKIPNNLHFLKKTILDKQIVDTNNMKVVRVNDIKLIKVEDGYRFVAVDCGFSGLLRRLKLLSYIKKMPFLKTSIPEKFISWSNVQPMKSDVEDLRLKVTYEKIFNLHPADISEIISLVHHEERTAIVESLNNEILADVLPFLDEKIQVNIFENLSLDRAIKVIEEMPSDEAVDILGDVTAKKAEQVLQKLKPKDKKDFQELLRHEDDTAGGLMNPDFIAFSSDLSVLDVLENIKKLKPPEEMFYYIYVTNENNQLIGVVSLQALILANTKQKIIEIMQKKVVTVKVDQDKNKIGELVSKYNLLAIPVIDNNKKILGVITIDDVVEQFIPAGNRKKRDVIN